jgi:hypothetical protein
MQCRCWGTEHTARGANATARQNGTARARARAVALGFSRISKRYTSTAPAVHEPLFERTLPFMSVKTPAQTPATPLAWLPLDGL